MPIEFLPSNPSLEHFRKQAKRLLEAVRANDAGALARVAEFHPQGDAARSDFTLVRAQLVIARTYGFPSWARLRKHLEIVGQYEWRASKEDFTDAAHEGSPDRFLSLACLTYQHDNPSRRDEAREMLRVDPSLAIESIHTAAAVGDVENVRARLAQDPASATSRGGPHRWEPLLYAVYSRLNSTASGHSTLEVARLLLEHGADPNAGALWEGNYLFTALTGAFGEGEQGPTNQPEHQECYALARLLLEAGADPNDGQTLYNRIFRRGAKHLELLFEFGLGRGGDGVWFKRLGAQLAAPARMLEEQLEWAVRHDYMDRVELLVANGVDVNSAHNRARRPPYDVAVLAGNRHIAEYLLAHGAKSNELSELDSFTAACLAADEPAARALLAKSPSLIDALGGHRVHVLSLAATGDKRDAIRLMVRLGFDVNELQRTTALHEAAWSGRLEMVTLLLELGANPLIRDRSYNGTARDWARHNHQTAVAEFLDQFEPPT